MKDNRTDLIVKHQWRCIDGLLHEIKSNKICVKKDVPHVCFHAQKSRLTGDVFFAIE